MANWKKKLVLRDLSEKHDNEEMTASQVGKEVSKRLAEIYPENERNPDIHCFINRFDDVKDEDEFDDIMTELYDWGDADHRLWVAMLG